MKRRYLNGHPVFEPGEKVEVRPPNAERWFAGVVQNRLAMADIATGERSYAYIVQCGKPGEPLPNMLVDVDDAAFIRQPGGVSRRVLRAHGR